MIDPVEELKIRARILQKSLEQGAPATATRLRCLRELRRASDEDVARFVPDARLKHCLAVVAREAGFDDFQHASAILTGERSDDFGTLLCQNGSAAHWNIWSASYEEARDIRAAHGGFLLPFKRQFFVTDRYYVEELGLDPDDPDFALIGRDWARPADPAARVRLYAKLFAAERTGQDGDPRDSSASSPS